YTARGLWRVATVQRPERKTDRRWATGRTFAVKIFSKKSRTRSVRYDSFGWLLLKGGWRRISRYFASSLSSSKIRSMRESSFGKSRRFRKLRELNSSLMRG